MSRLAQFRSLLTRARQDAPAPASQLAQDREAAASELAAARDGVGEAEAAYQSALLGATDEGLRALDDARRAATIRLDRATALVERFAAQTVAAEEAKAKADLARIIEAAVAAQGEFREAVDTELPAMAEKARAILALRADAERATAIANKAIAEAGEGEPLPGVEAFRALPGRPYEELSREVRDLWVDDAGNASGYQEQIKTRGDGAGTLMLPHAHHLRIFTRKQAFQVVEFLPAEPGATPPSLDVALAVPDPYPVVSQAQDRRPVTEMKSQGPVREVAKVAPSRLDRIAMGHGA
ncbi:hypothetical protein [Methylobacterium sp. J-068]|uniref:hypothetical protein n=1 Tax=Methylobacterium sp. J-068 TaxID=2836649 RepID=UPI001FBAC969|nr:hypothetical protein [Methylobacterium sp. J-068]MCJ2032623.1 hypothetical protein [Methylobacterium sp. J-068]